MVNFRHLSAHSPPLPLFYSVLLLFLRHSTATSAASLSEIEALLELKSAFNSPIDLSSWNLNQVNSTSTLVSAAAAAAAAAPPPYCTSWRGVACSAATSAAAAANFSVVSITLPTCLLTGTLSPAISFLPNLASLDLSNNSISGPIPTELTNLSELRHLDLSGNSFSGSLPTDWRRLTSLQLARLQNNELQGSIPDSIFAAPSLRRLQLGHNRLSGELPRHSLGRNPKIMSISVEYNNLSGEIPSEIALITSLRSFYAANNSFYGTLPASIANLTKILNLHLQNNLLQSTIPASWSALAATLKTLDLSGNNLSGEVPAKLLQRFNGSAFAGNAGLCAKAAAAAGVLLPCPLNFAPPAAEAPPPPPESGKWKKRETPIHPEIIVGAAMAVIIIVSVLCLLVRRSGGGGNEAPPPEGAAEAAAARFVVFDSGIAKYGYEQIVSRAGFYDTAHVVGRGRYSTVYRSDIGLAAEGAKVAVKVFKNAIANAAFEAEMERLTRLKHSNLLPIKAYFSDTAEKAIIMDFMPYGSLHSLLHGVDTYSGSLPSPPLHWSARQRIAAGTAHALHYLHRSHLLHHNVTSTNVLLTSSDLSPLLADYCLLPLSSVSPPAEKPGYAAPELAAGRRSYSQTSDVYSFGVVLLELVTGRRAEVVTEGGGPPALLSEWAAEMWRMGRAREAMDGVACMTCPFPEYLDTAMKLALDCVRDDPLARPKMYEVASVLEGLASIPSPLKTPDLFSP